MQTQEVKQDAATGPAAPSPAEEYRSVPLALLVESRLNPRKTFSAAELEELAVSIRQKGVLQPLLVRPLSALQQITRKSEAEQFEIVFGARRFRASKLAGLAEVPVRIRTLNDKEVLEVQVIENLQREGLHPLEEADGYQQLHEKHGYSIDDLAAKVGKSKGYVYGRLRLCSLTKPARVAFMDNKLTPSTALLVARIPTALQDKAVKGIVHGEYGNSPEPMSHRDASEYVQREFMLRLAGAPFQTDDAFLLATAGACITCPKRTGNQRELFSDVNSADVCTDPTCFQQKRDAAWAIKRREAETGGRRVLSDADAKKTFSPHGGGLEYSAAYVDLNAANYLDGGGKTYKQLIGKQAEATGQVILARDPKTAAVHELVPKAAVKKLLKEAGHGTQASRKPAASNGSASSSADARAREKFRDSQELMGRVEAAGLAQIAAAVEKRGELNDGDLRLVANVLMDAALEVGADGDVFELIAVRRGVMKAPTGQQFPSQAAKSMRATLAKLKGPTLRSLVVELAVCSITDFAPTGAVKRKDAYQHYGVDVKKLQATVKAQLDAERAHKKAAAKAAVKKPGRPHASA